VCIVPRDDNRSTSARLKIAVFATVLTLIVIILAAQRIPSAKRPTLRHPSVTTTTIITTITPSKRP
jgi:hypothetical protein